MNKQFIEDKAVELAKRVTPEGQDITPILEALLEIACITEEIIITSSENSMKFRIIEVSKEGKVKYEVYYLDCYDNRVGIRWRKVIWDSESSLNFCDKNYTDTIEEAIEQAKIFKENYEKTNGKLVKEFVL